MRPCIIYARSSRWAEVAARAEDLIAGAAFEPIKIEAKTTAGFLVLEDGSCAFVKRFDSGPGSRPWWTRIRRSRARRSIEGARLVQSRGFRCPAPYAAIEWRDGFAVRASYLISEPLRAARTLSEFLDLRRRARGPEVARRRGILAAAAGEIRKLHDARLFSSDLQETNLMVEEASQGPVIYFVDLDGFKARRRVAWRMRERNLVQLDRSIGRFLSRTARLRFLYEYLGARPPRLEARRIVAHALQRKARENRKRQYRRARAYPAGRSLESFSSR